MRFSVIIPVYNRPYEVRELLQSLTAQEYRDFEVIVVEDGSAFSCKEVVKNFAARLDVKYFVKENGGPGPARNYGAEHAKGEYLIILDSDVIVPAGYFSEIENELASQEADAFGGPDSAHPDFTPVQKAINYSMTSFFTTGGIRGGKVKMDKFYPRSFNLGIKAEVYKALGGFSAMRYGEDIDLSIRIFKGGYKCRLFPGAWVWHKRRTNLKSFFKQVHHSGEARIVLHKKHPGSMKAVHTLPALFTLALAFFICIAPLPMLIFKIGFGWSVLLAWSPLLLWILAIFTDSTIKNRNPLIGLLSIVSSFIQLTGYGTGFLKAWWRQCVLKG